MMCGALDGGGGLLLDVIVIPPEMTIDGGGIGVSESGMVENVGVVTAFVVSLGATIGSDFGASRLHADDIAKAAIVTTKGRRIREGPSRAVGSRSATGAASCRRSASSRAWPADSPRSCSDRWCRGS